MSEFQSLVDRTRFDLVRRLMNRPGSPVTDVLFVESAILLCEMADLLTGPVNATGRQRLSRWFEEGKITLGTTAAPRGRLLLGARWLDIYSIDREALCDVLYLPPFYLVHLTCGHSSSFAAYLER